jgi:serine/threonine protein kinase
VIAEGGAATVFEAEHTVTGRSVALKLPRGRWLGNAEVAERLLREARALNLAKHKNVVAALDAGIADDGMPYLALELLEGRVLPGLIAARQRLSFDETVALGCQLCDALTLAHERGVVHRDVKPGNLFVAVDESGHECLKLLDFGVAAFRGSAETEEDPKLTMQGAVLGTAEYMAPEQLLAASDVDHRCDIYATGAALYECLTGAVPFEGNYARVLVQATTEPLPPVRCGRPDVPSELARVIETALARSRDDRFAGASEMGRALLAAMGLDTPPPTRLCIGQPPAAGTTVVRPTSATVPSRERRFTPSHEPAAKSPPEQRRRQPRAPYVTPVSLRRQNGSTVFGRSEDISEGGLLVMTAELCEQGERVLVRFALPGTGQFVEAVAETRWVRAGRGLGVAGFEFVDLAAGSCDIIRQYVTGWNGGRSECVRAEVPT